MNDFFTAGNGVLVKKKLDSKVRSGVKEKKELPVIKDPPPFFFYFLADSRDYDLIFALFFVFFYFWRFLRLLTTYFFY